MITHGLTRDMKLPAVQNIKEIFNKHGKLLAGVLVAIAICGALAYFLKDFPGKGSIFEWVKARHLYNEGHQLLAAGKAPEAIAKMQAAVTYYPNDATFLIGLSQAQLLKDDVIGTESSLQRAVRVDPKRAEAWLQLSSMQLKRRDLRSAEKSITQAFKLEPKNPAVLANMGLIWALTDRQKDAEELFDKTNVFADSAEFWLAAGKFNMMKGDMQKAEAGFRQAAALKPSAENFSYVAMILLKQGKSKEGEENLKAAAQHNPNSSYHLGALGRYYLVNHRYKEAIEPFSQAAKLAPSDPQRWKDFGQSCFLAGDFQSAEEPLYRSAHLNNRDASVWGMLVETFRKQGKYSESIEALKQFLYLGGSRSPQMWIYAAEIYHDAGSEENMRESYRQALALKPNTKTKDWLISRLQEKELIKKKQAPKQPSQSKQSPPETTDDQAQKKLPTK